GALVPERGGGRPVLPPPPQTEAGAALCSRVVALAGGRVRFDATPNDLTELAGGQVWTAGGREPDARLSWRTSEGLHRHVGEPPSGAELAEPSLEDGYLLMLGAAA